MNNTILVSFLYLLYIIVKFLPFSIRVQFEILLFLQQKQYL